MSSFLRTALAALTAFGMTASAHAAILSFNFSGQVTSLLGNDSSGAFASNFAAGDAVTGQWTIDTTAADNVLIPGAVHYYDASFSAVVSGKAFSGSAQYRIFDNNTPGGDGFSIINETGTYSAPTIGPLVASTFFIQYLDMPSGTLSGFGIVTDPVSLIPLANTSYAPNGLRLDNPDGTFGGLYFRIDSVNAVPEPSTYALLAGGLAVMAMVARRRRPRPA